MNQKSMLAPFNTDNRSAALRRICKFYHSFDTEQQINPMVIYTGVDRFICCTQNTQLDKNQRLVRFDGSVICYE